MRFKFVPASVTVTVTFGKAAPDASVTVPRNCAWKEACAARYGAEIRKTAAIAVTERRRKKLEQLTAILPSELDGFSNLTRTELVPQQERLPPATNRKSRLSYVLLSK